MYFLKYQLSKYWETPSVSILFDPIHAFLNRPPNCRNLGLMWNSRVEKWIAKSDLKHVAKEVRDIVAAFLKLDYTRRARVARRSCIILIPHSMEPIPH